MTAWGWEYPEYVPVAEKKRRALQKLSELQKKNSAIRPVIIQGTALVRNWWGKAWNTNLERYADYHNRIGRGKSYVRHGAVLDLQIEKGNIAALVQGSRSKPYKVVVRVKTLPSRVWQEIKAACGGRLESLQDLIAGVFPRELGDIFLSKDTGLFPSPKEISFDCSCPDWASMCKHVAATLYGIGARLDDDPMLFFTLRGVDVQELVRRTVAEQTDKLLKKAGKKSSRVLESANLSELFGIDVDPAGMAPVLSSPAVNKKAQPKTSEKASYKKPVPQKKTKRAAVSGKKKAGQINLKHGKTGSIPGQSAKAGKRAAGKKLHQIS